MLAAFGLRLDVPLRPMGRAFVADHLVLKQVVDEDEAAWVAATMSTLRPKGVRLPSPMRAHDGRWVVEGWIAHEKIVGRPCRDWHEVLDAGRALHRATAALERPDVLDRRTHRWAVADRLAWGEGDPGRPPALVGALLDRLRPVDGPSQLVHGDLTGNVLAAPGLPPAVLDVSPYWRPTGWAEAVVVVDAIVWNRAGVDLVDALAPEQRAQLLARATLFRLFAGEPAGPHERWVAHLCRLLDGDT